MTNFAKLTQKYPDESIDEVFLRFIEGKSNSSVTFSNSVINGFIKFHTNQSEPRSTLSKEDASKELSMLPRKLANNEISQDEYRKRQAQKTSKKLR